MSQPARFILHPTDFSSRSQLAYAHALRVAVHNEANLAILHVGDDSAEDWDRFPAIRKTLQRWGIMGEDAKRSDILAKLGVGVEKVIAEQKDVVQAITGFFQRRPVDLIVLATTGRDGIASWLMPSKAEKIASKTRTPTLFVPSGSHGCVSLETGEVTLEHIIVPVDREPDPGDAIERGLRAMSAFGSANAKLSLVHVGGSEMPHIPVPDGPWNVEHHLIPSGNPANEILALAKSTNANLIAMVTDGEHGFLDAFRGTTTDHVVRNAPCPVLAIPTRA